MKRQQENHEMPPSADAAITFMTPWLPCARPIGDANTRAASYRPPVPVGQAGGDGGHGHRSCEGCRAKVRCRRGELGAQAFFRVSHETRAVVSIGRNSVRQYQYSMFGGLYWRYWSTLSIIQGHIARTGLNI